MFNVAQIKTAFASLVGFRQNYNSSGTQLNTVLSTSNSGYWVNAEHPHITIDNLLSIAPGYSRISGQDAQLAFNDWLNEQLEDATIRALTDWWTFRMQKKTGNGLVERNRLINGAGPVSATDADQGKRVFHRIEVKESKSLVFKALKVGFHFTGTESFTVRLYEEGKNIQLDHQVISYTDSKSVQWFDLNWEIEGGKVYYISYDQNNISSQSIDALRYYPLRSSKYFSVLTGTTEESGGTMWDYSEQSYGASSYGMNLEYSISCDYTDFFIENKDVFAPLISIVTAIQLAYTMALNPNVNDNRHTHNVSVQQMLYTIDGDSQGRPGGLKDRYKQIMNAIQLSTEGIDTVCLKCRKRGIKIGAI